MLIFSYIYLNRILFLCFNWILNNLFGSLLLIIELVLKSFSFHLHVLSSLLFIRNLLRLGNLCLLDIEVGITLSPGQWIFKTNVVLSTHIFSCRRSLLIICWSICVLRSIDHYIKIVKDAIILMCSFIFLSELLFLIIRRFLVCHWSLDRIV